jgi:Protein of unknown function (DUF2806)
LAEEQTEESPERSSKPLVEVKVAGANIDIEGIEKFTGVVDNLIKALSRGVGKIYEPIGRVRDAKADRAVATERIQTLIDLTKKQADLTELRRRLGINQDTSQESQIDRALSYLAVDLLRKQHNREKTIEAVTLELKNAHPERDTDAKIDDDWLTQFWNLAENISQEEVRSFMARLLVKEASLPGGDKSAHPKCPIDIDAASSSALRALLPPLNPIRQ